MFGDKAWRTKNKVCWQGRENLSDQDNFSGELGLDPRHQCLFISIMIDNFARIERDILFWIVLP